jgi:hypothetical protein
MKRFKPLALWLGALLAIAIALIVVESDFLWKVQQYDLFLYTTLFFKQQMVVPGGMLSYLGAFFTQFFYYPWLGVLMLCGWWLLLMWLTKRTFCLPDRWSIVTLIPVAILLTANMSLGYWVYTLGMRGYFFAPTIGTTAVIALMWVFRKLPERLWLQAGFIVLVALTGYPLMGVYALAAVLLMGVWTWRLDKNLTRNAVRSGVALLAVVAIPLFYYRFVYYQTNLLFIYEAALPDFSFDKTYPEFKIPYYVLAGILLAFTVTFRSTWPEEVVKREVKEQKKSKNKKGEEAPKEKKPILRWAVQGLLLAALAAGVWHFWYKDDNFHHELRMQRCIEKADWEGVIEEGRKQDSEPTRAIVMMHNLALSRLGRQCDEMYNFRKGSKRSNSPTPIYMFNTAGRLIYYHYGVMNECHRMCMEDGVSIGWSVELLQYMARTALLSKEPQTARKFVNLLRQTQFYGDWADHIEKLIDNPDLLAKDPETGPITHMMHYGDIQSEGDGHVEKNLMTMLSRQDADDTYFQEQAVLAAMWARNPNEFWPRFELYLNQRLDQPVPRIIQEAAYLFGVLGQQDFVDILPIEPSVKASFQGFMEMMKQYQGMPQLRDYLYQRYGNTYYFEYFFLKDITYY